MKWLDKLNLFPPCRCRMLAKSADGKRMLTNREIACKMGVTAARVSQISNMTCWDHLPARTIQSFTSACGINLNRIRSDIYKRSIKMKACIKKMPPQQRKMLGRLILSSRQIGQRSPSNGDAVVRVDA